MIFKTIKGKVASFDVISLLKIVPFAFAFHELEEWNVLSWHQKHQPNTPVVNDIALRTIFLFLIVISFVVFYTSVQIKNKKITASILFPFLALMCYNGIVHLYWTIYFMDYSPGLIFGFFLGVPLMVLIMYKLIRENLIKKWYAILVWLLFTGLFIEVIHLGNKLEPGIVNAMLFGQKLAQWIWF